MNSTLTLLRAIMVQLVIAVVVLKLRVPNQTLNHALTNLYSNLTLTYNPP